jgi:hypothetical protein
MCVFVIYLGKDYQRQVKYIKDKLKLIGDFRINVASGKNGAKVIISAENIDFVKSIIKETISDLILLFYKYNAFADCISAAQFGLAGHALLGAILSFDRKNERRLIMDNLDDFQNEINVDGFFNFNLDLIRERWADFSEIVSRLYEECEEESDVFELISFIMSSEIGYGAYIKIDYDNNITINDKITPTVEFTADKDINMVISILKERPISITIQSPKTVSKEIIHTISSLGDKI